MSATTRGIRDLDDSAKYSTKLPNTSDGYLIAGVGLEEAAEKWRAGDPAKSSRFYARAIQTYDEGLNHCPNSFDLSYNRARVQYAITQDPSLLEQNPSSMVVLLQECLESHKYALSLKPLNIEVLFNTAQVLSSLAEHIVNLGMDEHVSDTAQQYLEDACLLFQKCLSLQEEEFGKGAPEPRPGQKSLYVERRSSSSDANGASTNECSTDHWASLEYPTTRSSLVETVIANLEALETSCHTITARNADRLANIENTTKFLIEQKLHKYIGLSENAVNGSIDEELQESVADVTLKLQYAIIEAQFRSSQIGVSEYDESLKRILESRSPLTMTCRLICTHADALIAFSNAVEGYNKTDLVRWISLSRALSCLSEATKLSHDRNIASVHMARGDIEMLRYILSSYGELPESISNENVQSTILHNAEIYYRGAAGWANSTTTRIVGLDAEVKEVLVSCFLTKSINRLANLIDDGLSEAKVSSVIHDMIDVSLITKEMLRKVPSLYEKFQNF